MGYLWRTVRHSRGAIAAVIAVSAASIAVAAVLPAAGARAAVASTTAPKLTINPSAIFYPCSEGSVTFSVKHFPARSSVTLHLGSASATSFASVSTNGVGSGNTTVSFNDYYPGFYKVFATDASVEATKPLTVGECP